MSILTLDSDDSQPADMLQLLIHSDPGVVAGVTHELQWMAPSDGESPADVILQILQRAEVRQSPAYELANTIKAALREQQGTGSSCVDTVDMVSEYLRGNQGITENLKELSSAVVSTKAFHTPY